VVPTPQHARCPQRLTQRSDHMKHTPMLLAGLLLILTFNCGCVTTDSHSPSFPKIRFDENIASVSFEGFRVGISPRVAKSIASERGYRVDHRFSDVTFDDLIQSPVGGRDYGKTIYLNGFDKAEGVAVDLQLEFAYGKLIQVRLEHVYHGADRPRGEKKLNRYLAKYPFLKLSKEVESFRVYSYKPHDYAFLIASIEEKTYTRVTISLRDGTPNVFAIYDRYYGGP